MKNIVAFTAVAFTLASCGGGGIPGPTSRDIGILPSGFVATYDGVTDEVVLSIDGVEVARLANDEPLGTGFTLFADPDSFTVYAQTISGDGAVFAVSSPIGILSASGLAGVHVARLGDTDLPNSGSATFNGNYAGLFVDSALEPTASIAGDAQLIANFASASISGNITNRSGVGLTADDVILLPSAISSAGAFSGTTTGGDIVGLAAAEDGQYVGLIVGDTGNEVVGGLSIVQIGFGTLLLETGVFVAAE